MISLLIYLVSAGLVVLGSLGVIVALSIQGRIRAFLACLPPASRWQSGFGSCIPPGCGSPI